MRFKGSKIIARNESKRRNGPSTLFVPSYVTRPNRTFGRDPALKIRFGLLLSKPVNISGLNQSWIDEFTHPITRPDVFWPAACSLGLAFHQQLEFVTWHRKNRSSECFTLERVTVMQE